MGGGYLSIGDLKKATLPVMWSAISTTIFGKKGKIMGIPRTSPSQNAWNFLLPFWGNKSVCLFYPKHPRPPELKYAVKNEMGKKGRSCLSKKYWSEITDNGERWNEKDIVYLLIGVKDVEYGALKGMSGMEKRINWETWAFKKEGRRRTWSSI